MEQVIGPDPASAAAPPPCHITFGGMTATEAPRVEVRAWLERLGALTATMIGGRVLIDVLDQGRRERRYQVRMELSMPRGVVVVGFDHPSNRAHEDIYVAIRNAFRGARRELEVYVREYPPQ
jgi:ribosome-associated translation inhibitor RaiA